MRALVLLCLFGTAFIEGANVLKLPVVDPATNATCILIEGSLTGTVKYARNNKTESFNFNVDSVRNVKGECGEEVQTVTAELVINDYSSLNSPWILFISFNKTANATKENTVFDIQDYTLTTVRVHGYNGTAKTYKRSKDAEKTVEAHLEHAYQCSVTGLALEDESTLTLNTGRVIAFAALNSTEFPDGKVDLCFLDAKTADIVPIVVGLCLAALIFIVLIAYCIGRARARRDGYSSV